MKGNGGQMDEGTDLQTNERRSLTSPVDVFPFPTPGITSAKKRVDDLKAVFLVAWRVKL